MLYKIFSNKTILKTHKTLIRAASSAYQALLFDMGFRSYKYSSTNSFCLIKILCSFTKKVFSKIELILYLKTKQQKQGLKGIKLLSKRKRVLKKNKKCNNTMKL